MTFLDQANPAYAPEVQPGVQPTETARQCLTVDQSDRRVPINLRQSGRTPVEMLISTRVRKSPYWHLSVEAGCWRATVYNRMYHPRGYVRPQDGGAMVEYEALINHVTMWNVAVERQIRVKGPDAEAFVNYVITRDATRIKPMHAKYVILCNEEGGILNDPVLLRISEDEFWFSLSDSDIEWWLRGVNNGQGFKVSIGEIDVCPVQIQGPKSEALMVDLFGEAVRDIPFYGLMSGQLAGHQVIVSQTGFTGEKGYEIYLIDATVHAEDMWNAVLEAGVKHQLMVIAPAHHRRIAAGILSWGQDMDQETLPFQCNLSYQVPREKAADYIGKERLEAVRSEIEAGRHPFKLTMVGIKFGGKPITDYAPDFWLIAGADGAESVGYITSPWYSPELQTNIALGYVPVGMKDIGTRLDILLPDEYAEAPSIPVPGEVVEVPFRPSVNPNSREVAKQSGRDSPSSEAGGRRRRPPLPDHLMRTWNSVATTRESPVDVPLQAPEVSVPQLVTGYSIEATPQQLESAVSLDVLLPAGTSVYIPFLPKADFSDTVTACRRIVTEGLRPVPHVAARAIPSLGMLSESLRMLADEGVDSLLLIAGDRRQAFGPFQSTLPVFDSGLLQRYGFDKIGVAGHPEGHPDADDALLMDALRKKARYAADTGTAMWVVTQFAFTAEPLVSWLDRLRASAIDLPVRIGLPGPAKVQTLLRYAAQCGIGGSARMLARRPDTLTRLLGRWTPEDMLGMLARSATFRPEQLTGVHVFPFGGLMQSVDYFNALSADAGQR